MVYRAGANRPNERAAKTSKLKEVMWLRTTLSLFLALAPARHVGGRLLTRSCTTGTAILRCVPHCSALLNVELVRKCLIYYFHVPIAGAVPHDDPSLTLLLSILDLSIERNRPLPRRLPDFPKGMGRQELSNARAAIEYIIFASSLTITFEHQSEAPTATCCPVVSAIQIPGSGRFAQLMTSFLTI